MDPITHTLVGVALGGAFFKRRDGSEAVTILALASNLPDIDVAVHLSGDPAAVTLRRTFGHSLLLVPLWAALAAILIRRRTSRLGTGRRFFLFLLGAVVHLFFDLINSFGVVLLWPLSSWRPELATVFIIDFFLTGILAAPLLLRLLPRLKPKTELLWRAAVVSTGVYLAFCGVNHALAAHELEREAPRADFLYVFPEPLGPHRWRGVARDGNLYTVFLIHSLSGSVQERDVIRSQDGDPRVAAARASPLGVRLERFFKAPVWEVREPAQHPVEVTVRDLRFSPLVFSRRPVFVFLFHVHRDGRVEEAGWAPTPS